MSAPILKKGRSIRGKWTKAQRDYVSRCIEDGCAVCSILGMAGTASAWHHTDGPDSVHQSPERFAALVGMTEAQLVDKMQRDYGWSGKS